MTTNERHEALRKWVHETICKGRQMKTPGDDDRDVQWKEPDTYVGYYPMTNTDEAQSAEKLYESVSPSILIIPTIGYAKNMEEERFDRYSGIHRPESMGKTMPIQFLFTVYDPGTRNPPAFDSEGKEIWRKLDGEGQGMRALFDWMDDLERHLLGARHIPGTDMYVAERSITSGLRTEQGAVTDSRPTFIGMLNCVFGAVALEKQNEELDEILK